MGRTNKRQQREQRTLKDLQQSPGESKIDGETDEQRPTQQLFSAVGAYSSFVEEYFAFGCQQHLEVQESTQPESDDDAGELVNASKKTGKSKKQRKKKTKPVSGVAPNDVTLPPSASPATLPPRAALSPAEMELAKKINKEQKKVKKGPVEKLDDIDRALRELGISSGTPSEPGSATTSTTSPAIERFRDLLSVNPKHLDGDSELRRFFGSKVVNSNKSPASKLRHPTIRSQLTNPPPEWPMVRTSQGLSMRALDPGSEVTRKIGTFAGDKWWTVEHSTSYKTVQLQFLETVQMGDYQGFMEILRRHPWHIDSLLQMSEVARHQEDNMAASDFVARALFAFERSFLSVFSLTTGLHRLDFDRIENRPFFLALARYVVNLQKRGTNRSAFEFARLLFALDPGSDPHGALFHLDFLAIRSGMHQWLLDVWNTYEELGKDGSKKMVNPNGKSEDYKMDVRLLPGWMWSRALAMRGVEEQAGDRLHIKSTEALRDAICAFPAVLPVLADKVGINLSEAFRAHPACRIWTEFEFSSPGESTLHLLAHLYATRSAELWKVPDPAEWLRSTTSEPSLLSRLYSPSSSKWTSPTAQAHERAVKYFGRTATTPENIVRHVLVIENRSLMVFLHPNSVPQQMVSYDPVPPRTALSMYDETYFGGRTFHVDSANGERQRVAGAGDIDRELRIQEMILGDLERRHALRIGMEVPGAFPGGGGTAMRHEGEVDSDFEDTVDSHDEEDDLEDDEEEDDENAPRTHGFMNTVYNLLWGRRPAPANPPDSAPLD